MYYAVSREGFWSNEEGWVMDVEVASGFDSIEGFDLPIGKDVMWTYLPFKMNQEQIEEKVEEFNNMDVLNKTDRLGLFRMENLLGYANNPIVQVQTPGGVMIASKAGDINYPGIWIEIDEKDAVLVEWDSGRNAFRTHVYNLDSVDNDEISVNTSVLFNSLGDFEDEINEISQRLGYFDEGLSSELLRKYQDNELNGQEFSSDDFDVLAKAIDYGKPYLAIEDFTVERVAGHLFSRNEMPYEVSLFESTVRVPLIGEKLERQDFIDYMLSDGSDANNLSAEKWLMSRGLSAHSKENIELYESVRKSYKAFCMLLDSVRAGNIQYLCSDGTATFADCLPESVIEDKA